MSSPETYIAFAAVMLVIALLGVAIDWFGKPLRHRKFVPKMYRFPDERVPRRAPARSTPWSDSALVLPVSQGTLEPAPRPTGPPPDTTPPARPLFSGAVGSTTTARSASPYPDAHLHPVDDAGADTAEDRNESGDDAAPLDVPTQTVGAVGIDHPDNPDDPDDPDGPGEPDTDATADAGTEHGAGSDETDPSPVSVFADVSPPGAEPDGSRRRAEGWEPGDYVFNFTRDGREPSPTTVRQRFWKNVGAAAGASTFGQANLARLQSGKPPQRRNPRTGRIETMQLPAATYDDSNGELPVPSWPTVAIDPFASGSDG